MNYRDFRKRQKQSIALIIFLAVLRVAAIAAVIWLGIFAINSISDSLKENNTSFVKELGKEWGEVKAQFNEGVEGTE